MNRNDTTPPVISIIGRSGSGKTTLIEKLIAHFTREGRRVAVIKHMKHDFQVDHPGKDTHRYRQAGAHAAAITNDRELAVMMSIAGARDPSDIAREYFGDCDLVIVEGYKEGGTMKIEVVGDSPEGPLFASGEAGVAAVVTDRVVSTGLPRFGRDDAGAVAGFIETLVARPGSRGGP